MDDSIRKYMAEIGRRGGKKSKRPLTRDEAQRMIRIRESRRQGGAPRQLSPRCLQCDSFDRGSLSCTAESCPHNVPE